MSKQLLAPGGLTAACAESVHVIIVWLLDPGAFQKLDTKQKILSLQEVGQKRKIVVKIEFTPLSLDRKFFPFKKGFKKIAANQNRSWNGF